jgi:hypothetical protein
LQSCAFASLPLGIVALWALLAPLRLVSATPSSIAAACILLSSLRETTLGCSPKWAVVDADVSGSGRGIYYYHHLVTVVEGRACTLSSLDGA